MSLVPCPFRGDHMIVNGHMHGPGWCPPPPGERGEHRRNKRLRVRLRAKQAEGIIENRGVVVAGVGGSKAKSHRLGRKKTQQVVG